MVPAPHRNRDLAPPLGTTLLKSVAPVVIGVAIALAMHFVIAPHIERLYAKILLDIGINIILAVSLNIVNGFTGQFSIGHAGFMALGGYTAAALVYYGSFSWWGQTTFAGGVLSFAQDPRVFTGPVFAGGDALFFLACLAGGLVAAGAGVLVGLPSLRLKGDYLAIVTLGFGEIVRILIQQTPGQLLEPAAIAATPLWQRPLHLGGALGFARSPFYTTPFWVWLFVGLTVLTAYRLRRSTYGRAFLAIRENEIAAQAMGVPVTRYKVMAFVFAAFFAGSAGALFAHQVGTTLNPGELGFQKSFDILIMVMLGGMGSISGSILAAVVLTILPEVLREPPHIWPLMLAGVILVGLVQKRRALKPALALVAITLVLEILRTAALGYEIDLSRYRLIFYALALILMMILRPRGLLGAREFWDLPPHAPQPLAAERPLQD